MTARPPVSGEPSTALQRLLDYSWGLHLAGTPNEAEAIGLIEAARAEARATPPSLDAAHRPAFDPWVLCVCNNNHRLSEYASLASGQES